MKAQPDLNLRWRTQKGQLGHILVEREMRNNSGEWKDKGIRVNDDWQLIDGHEETTRFTNLKRLKHLDIIIATPENEIKAICEVKTTTDPSKRGFHANGFSPQVMNSAYQAGIPIYLAVVRLRREPPKSIGTDEGFQKYLEKLRNDPTQFSITYFDEGEFYWNHFVLR